MSSGTTEPIRSPRAKFWVGVCVVMAGQVALILQLGGPLPSPSIHVRPAPMVQWNPEQAGALLAEEDPALFVLPHRESFSGEAWLGIPKQQYQPESWEGTNRWLPLFVEELGATFQQFVRTNPSPQFPAIAGFVPGLTMPELPAAPLAAVTRMRAGGELARRLRSPIELPPQPASDLLTNSVVQILVDAGGRVLSAVLLSGSGSPADQRALALAREARFAPVEITGPDRAGKRDPDPVLGTLVFQWATVPLPASSPAALH